MAGKDELIGEVAKAQALLSRLEAEQEVARTRLAALPPNWRLRDRSSRASACVSR